jgi:hypothetical protein
MNTELTDHQIDLLIGMSVLKAMEEQANQPLPTDEEIAYYMTFAGLPDDDGAPSKSQKQINEEDHSHHGDDDPRHLVERGRKSNVPNKPPKQVYYQSNYNELDQQADQGTARNSTNERDHGTSLIG